VLKASGVSPPVAALPGLEFYHKPPERDCETVRATRRGLSSGCIIYIRLLVLCKGGPCKKNGSHDIRACTGYSARILQHNGAIHFFAMLYQ
jgi:hypothetical protein